ncbi:MAG: hypothetical protein LBV04_06715 [Deferribacteraceae bacterium]|nr:hypothetical protein [Deferribacteraceae bacterium]
MFVNSYLETKECTNLADFKAHIEKCVQNDAGEGIYNEIWCSLEEPESYPCISILAKGNEATVNYFFEDDKGNILPLCSLGDEEREGATTFATTAEEYSVALYQIITAQEAIDCAVQFFQDQKLPSCIDWEELWE